MASKKFDTFPYGLDTRRSVLTSQPGTLAVLNNCHVNQGAEIEKKKAFVPLALLPGTFGLEAVANSLVVFGSLYLSGPSFLRSRVNIGGVMYAQITFDSGAVGAATGFLPPVGSFVTVTGLGGTGYNLVNAVITNAINGPNDGLLGRPGTTIYYLSPGLAENITTDTGGTIAISPSTQLTVPVAYQQLLAPTGAAMASVIYSTVFGGKTFVIAAFADGSLYAFYDTNLVTDFVAGVNDIDFTSPTTIAAGLVALINQTAGYTAVQNGASFTVTASAGNNYTPSIVTKTNAGTITSILTSTAVAPFGQTGASGSFQIVAGQSGYAVDTLVGNNTNITAGNTVTINGVVYTFKATPATSGDVAIGTTALASVANLVAAINGDGFNTANAFVTAAVDVTGYSVNITAIASGTTPNNYAVSTANSASWAWTTAKLAGGNTNAITNVKVGTTNLLNGGTAIPMGVTPSATAAAVAASINLNTGIGFTATSAGGIVTITSTTLNASLNDSVLSVVVSDGIIIGNCSFWLQGSGFETEITAGGVDLITNGGQHYLTFPTAGATLALYNAAIVANIISNSSTYTAYTDGTLIYIAKLTTTSADVPIAVVVTVTPTGGNGTVTTPNGAVIQLTLSESVLNFTATSRIAYTTGLVSVTAAGGTSPYTYQWSVIGFPVGADYTSTIVTPKAASTKFTFSIRSNTTSYKVPLVTPAPFVATATCTVTDSAGNVSYTTVSLVFAG